jgi:predicted nucleic acid-binding protein
VEIIGPIRQELLSGIREPSKFARVRDRLRCFADLEIGTADSQEAASHFNRCRSSGIQGSFTDFLICAVGVKHQLSILTDDKEKVVAIQLHRH